MEHSRISLSMRYSHHENRFQIVHQKQHSKNNLFLFLISRKNSQSLIDFCVKTISLTAVDVHFLLHFLICLLFLFLTGVIGVSFGI